MGPLIPHGMLPAVQLNTTIDLTLPAQILKTCVTQGASAKKNTMELY